jgi:hypothetical protein
MLRTQWRARDVARTATQSRHLEQLEQELKKNPNPQLRAHILRLKVAWGRACRAPDPKHQAA